MKDRFIEIYKEHISRYGSDKLLEWLEGSDFFTAPASTRFHLCREGGLVEHSVHVYERLSSIVNNDLQFRMEKNGGEWVDTGYPAPTEEAIAICGLLHDVCKTNFYTVEHRNRKNEAGQWEKYPYYAVKDQLPYGHGERSVYIIGGFMRLSREEAFAIRWHMGGFDDSVKGGSYALNEAFEQFPLALLLHIADMQATYLDEKEEV